MFGISVFALLCFPADAATPSLASCRQTVQSFYSWYLTNTSHTTPIRAKPSLFGTQLLGMLRADAAAQAKSKKIVGLDFDPYVNAQIAPTRVVAGTAVQSGAACRVPVLMAFGKTAPLKVNNTAVLGMEHGQWVFTDFIFPTGGDLIKTLNILKAQRAKGVTRDDMD